MSANRRDDKPKSDSSRTESFIESEDSPVAGTGGLASPADRSLSDPKYAERHHHLMSFAINHVDEAAYLINEQAMVEYVNEKACRVLGYSFEELVTKSVADFDPEFPLDRWPQHWQELHTQTSLTFESIHQRKDGRRFPVEVTANYFEYGSQGFNLALVRDITERKRFERERATLLHDLGERVKENARLYAEQRSIADTLQEALLIMPERIEGLDFGYVYRSATVEPGKAGGDFYDLFDLEHDRVGIVIGDVSGKGLGAATLTMLVKNTLKAFAYAHDSPAKVMSLTNHVVERGSEESVFVTLFFGVLDKSSGLLTYCNGGHPPPILRSKNGATFLSGHGPAIGMLGDLTYADNQATIAIDSDLILYTDGAFEARRGDQFLGLDRLIDFTSGLGPLQTQEIPGAVLQKVQEFGQGEFRDDVALLAIARKNNDSN